MEFAPQTSEHSGLLEPFGDHRSTTCFDDAGADEKVLAAECLNNASARDYVQSTRRQSAAGQRFRWQEPGTRKVEHVARAFWR
jgi:hypothetical protein